MVFNWPHAAEHNCHSSAILILFSAYRVWSFMQLTATFYNQIRSWKIQVVTTAINSWSVYKTERITGKERVTSLDLFTHFDSLHPNMQTSLLVHYIIKAVGLKVVCLNMQYSCNSMAKKTTTSYETVRFQSGKPKQTQPDWQYFKLIYAKLRSPKAFISRNGNKAKRMCWLKKRSFMSTNKTQCLC